MSHGKCWRNARDSQGREPWRRITIAIHRHRTVAAKPHAVSLRKQMVYGACQVFTEDGGTTVTLILPTSNFSRIPRKVNIQNLILQLLRENRTTYDEPGKAERWRRAHDSRGRGPRRRVTVAPLSRRTVAAKLHAARPEGVWHTGRAKRLLRAAALRKMMWKVTNLR